MWEQTPSKNSKQKLQAQLQAASTGTHRTMAVIEMKRTKRVRKPLSPEEKEERHQARLQRHMMEEDRRRARCAAHLGAMTPTEREVWCEYVMRYACQMPNICF